MPSGKFLNILTALGAFSAGCAVLLGAFAAHGLKDKLSSEHLTILETAVRYQMIHSLALCLTGALALTGKWPGYLAPALLFFAGIVFFSGSLYLFVLFRVKWLGIITPIGGLAWVAAWFWLAIRFLRI